MDYSYNEALRDDSEDFHSSKNSLIKIQRDITEIRAFFKKIDEQEKKNAAKLEAIKDSFHGRLYTYIVGFGAISALVGVILVIVAIS